MCPAAAHAGLGGGVWTLPPPPPFLWRALKRRIWASFRMATIITAFQPPAPHPSLAALVASQFGTPTCADDAQGAPHAVSANGLAGNPG